MNDINNLQKFVQNWKQEYESKAKDLKLFRHGSVVWDDTNKIKFAKIFYHARGNFFELLWFLGSLAPHAGYKKVLISNIAEEFGANSPSHEQYYFDFVAELGIDMQLEILRKKYYIDSVKKFNSNFLEQVLTQKYAVSWSILSAYEVLDNVDYTLLYDLVKGFGVSARALRFFTIHSKVAHFETTEELLEKIWEEDRESVYKGFNFIMRNQLEMWENLGKEF
jgi:Iron-containing redox enzyme